MECQKTTDKQRSLSEEFYSRSPATQLIIKDMAGTTPTSKYKKDFSNIDFYKSATPEERKIMLQYGLIPLNKVLNLPK
jgi:hypothetical protein